MALSLALNQTAIGAHVVTASNGAIPTNASSVTSSNTAVFTATYSSGNDTVTVTPVAVGSATLTYSNPDCHPASISETITVTAAVPAIAFNDAAWVVS